MRLTKIIELAGVHGCNLETEFDKWIDTGKVDEDKIIQELDILKLSGLSLKVYSHYVEVYNSIKEFDVKGYISGKKL